ncbi:MAG: serine/threonine protein kinase, partial [Mycobacteriaceae bacterium]
MDMPVESTQREGTQRLDATQRADPSGDVTSVASGPSGKRPAGRGSRRGTRSTARGRLGAGLVAVPRVAWTDPAAAVMPDPHVAESQRYCSHCAKPVGRSSDGVPGNTEGACPHCGRGFSFAPKLHPGDLVAGQYAVQGCLAHGGLGWIYLAVDHNVSDRWVVLKGLLDSRDATAVAAAMA